MVVGVGLAGAIAFVAWPRSAPREPVAQQPNVEAVDTAAPTTHVRTSAAPIAKARPDAKKPEPLPAPADLEPNLAARWNAIEAAVRDADLAQLPALTQAELAKEPEAAPAIIHGVASLAVQGRDSDRALAGKTLSRWLREEQKRDTRDAQGNVVNIVEALGDLGGDEAVTSLIDVLDHEPDLALQTTAADRLATLGDPRALPAVDRFVARLASRPEPADDFEKELRAEAIKTAADAKARLKKETNE